MADGRRAETARQFSRAASQIVAACAALEQEGLPDPPVEQFLQSLEVLTQAVHQFHRPDQRVQVEPADLAGPAPCHVAARRADDRVDPASGA